MQLIIEFQEEYKRLDRICRDCLGSNEGVSEYIRQMESVSFEEHQCIGFWTADYKSLKHVRWVRNQLAHEVGTLTSDICKQSDLDFVQSYYQRIIKGTDSLTLLRKARASRTNNKHSENVVEKNSTNTRPKSLLSRIAEKFKKWFFGE